MFFYLGCRQLPLVGLPLPRTRLPEIQYLRTSIRKEQRREFAQLVDQTIGLIEAGHFLPHSGIRFPQNGCLSCPYLGLCLGNQDLVDAKLYRRPVQLRWF